MHGCPCGYLDDGLRACTCTDGAIRRYRRRLSGPLLDRIDIHLQVPRVPYEKLRVELAVDASSGAGEGDVSSGAVASGEPSAVVRQRVVAARERQRERLAGSKLGCNAEMGPAEVRRFCQVELAAETLVRAATQRLHLSARAYHRILKLARTIADLGGAAAIGAPHVAEALQYRPRAEEE
jgi:magnesium chelatase family protein